MATRGVVPRADAEGGVGTALKRWLEGRFVSLFCNDLTYTKLKSSGGSGAYLKVPNVTTVQRDALTPESGMLVYNSTVDLYQAYNGSDWVEVPSVSGLDGDVMTHDGDSWGVENTGPLTTPTRTLILLGSSMMFPATNGAEYYEETLAGGRIVRGASFGVSASNITAQIGHPMPSNWDGGTVKAEFLFATAATTGTVIFSLAGRSSISNDALDQAFGTAQAVTFNIGTQAGGAAWDIWTTAQTAAITLAGSPGGAGRRWVQWQIVRDPADTCSSEVVLLAVVIHYGTDGYGDA